jgi:protoheme IX farnesyltransferase
MTPRPGPWLRLSALAGAAATALVVVTGEPAGLSHKAAALVALALLAGVALSTWLGHRDRPALVAASLAGLAVFGLQVGLGGIVVLSDSAAWARGLHVAFGGIALAAAAVSAALAFRGGARFPAGSARDYVTLTKPRIMSLLLLTAAGGMAVGAEGLPPLGLFLAAMGGLALACGGASALNHVLDRDIDVHMKRTDKRPVATGRIAPERALEFGLALSAISFVVLTSFVNVLAALLAIFGNLFYVLVYTRWLKRTTPHNIVIGGAAGAVPPVVGWAAATGNLALPALFLFLIVFVWTPPHFWALALYRRGDYDKAGVPMLPVVAGEAATRRQIFIYALALVPVTLLPSAIGLSGFVYGVGAALLGFMFIGLSFAVLRDTTMTSAKRLFPFSILYLFLIFALLLIDRFATLALPGAV